MHSRPGNGIGTFNEKPLHAALKAWYALPGDGFEAAVDGYIVDIVRGDLLIEVQTSSFSSVRAKLAALAANHRLRLVYPVAREKWIVKVNADGERLSRRRSPVRGSFEHVFAGLVSFPQLLAQPNFSLHALLIQEEELRVFTGRGWRRRGWGTCEQRLLAVVDERLFETPADLGALLPADLAEPFTTAQLAARLRLSRRLAGCMTYCLRALSSISALGKRGNALLYVRTAQAGDLAA